MTALQQIEQLLPSMSTGEKAQVARWVEKDLSSYYRSNKAEIDAEIIENERV